MNEVEKELGKVGFTYAGKYDTSIAYEILDWVYTDKGSWASLRNDNVGHPLTDTSWWAPLADASKAVESSDIAQKAAEIAKQATEAAKVATTEAQAATNEAGSAANEANKAASLAKTAASEAAVAKTDTERATMQADNATAESKIATSEAGKATTNANNAADNASKAATAATNKINEMATYNSRVTDLEDAVFPYSLSVSGGGVFEKGTTQTINVSWVMKKGSSVVTPDSSKVNGEPATGTSKQFAGVTTTTTYSVEATKAGKTKTGSTTAVFVAASYCGVVAHDFTASESSIKALSKTVKNTKGYTISGQTLNNQKMCYAYPKSLGALTTIKDANNFDYINSYVRSEMQVSGETYYVYVLKDATSVSGFKQVYS